MHSYELVAILKAQGSEKDLDRTIAEVEQMVNKYGGTIAARENLGRRKLAFRIAKQTEGYYYLLRVDVPPENVRELDREFRRYEPLVRFMFVSADQGGELSVTSLRLGPAGASAKTGM